MGSEYDTHDYELSEKEAEEQRRRDRGEKVEGDDRWRKK